MNQTMKRAAYIAVIATLSLVAVVLAVIATVPALRIPLREYLFANERTILARADGLLQGQVDPVAVIKVKTADSLSLEIYAKSPKSDQLVFQKRIVLPEKRDGYFTFHGNATNLLLSDVDGDGGAEILAPTFDENLVPRLNIYKYDPSTQSFNRLGPENIEL